MERIEEGNDVFLHDGSKAVGAVREVHAQQIVVYVENAGDFTVPMSAVKEVDSGKVVLDRAKLEPRMREAIANEHRAEDPRLG
ncbi:MAG TPA: hypothetical protein VGG48_10520 [Rhizomicrobium sp.]|jgi:hypothetical protein